MRRPVRALGRHWQVLVVFAVVAVMCGIGLSQRGSTTPPSQPATSTNGESPEIAEVGDPRPVDFTPIDDGSIYVRQSKDGMIVDCNRRTMHEIKPVPAYDDGSDHDGFFNP